ncbi:MAG: ABC transporter transmembrane domain-containing protein, partial [Phycisphaeraceae bacterium]
MTEFWRFARMMLYYRRLLIIAAVGVFIDALCVMGGFGSLTWIITMFFEQGVTIRELVAEKLADSRLEQWTGLDLSPVAQWIPAGELAGLAFIMVFILALSLVGSVGRFTHEYCTMTVVMRTVMRVRKKLFNRLVHLPVAVANQDSTASRIARVIRDCQQLTNGFTALVSRAVRGIALGLALLALAFYLDYVLALTFLFIVPPVMIMIRKFGKQVRKASRRALKHYGIMLGAITESLQGLRVVKVHHAEGYERRRFNRINREALTQEMRARVAKAMSAPTVELFALIGVMGVMMIAAWSVYGGGRQASEVVSVLMMLAASAGMFRTVAGLNNHLQEAAAAAQSIDEVLTLPVENTARDEQGQALPAVPRHRRAIVFDDVWYTYPGSEAPAVAGVNLTVPAGSICAVVGSNGSGKSTLLGLLPRLYEPTEG